MSVVDSYRDKWSAMQQENRPVEPELPLQGGGGGGTSDDMIPIKEYIDARDDAIESRLTSKLDAVLTKLDSLPSAQKLDENRQSVIRNIWGGVISGFVALLAVLAYGADRFDGGVSVSPQLASFESNQAAIDNQQNAMLSVQDDKLDVIIKQTAKN